MGESLGRETDLAQGMVFAGSPENVAERIVNPTNFTDVFRRIGG